MASDASGKTSEKRKNVETYRNERNMKGNNFVTVGRIRNKSEKLGKSPEMRRTGSGTSLWKYPEQVGNSRKNPK